MAWVTSHQIQKINRIKQGRVGLASLPRAGSFCVWFDLLVNYNVRSTVHSDDTQARPSIALAANPPARPPQGAQRERRGRRQCDARVRASCTSCRLIRRSRLPRANIGLLLFASSTSRSPSKSATAIEPVITLPRGSMMLVGKVPSPALRNARLGLPSFPSSTSRLSSPSTSAAAIEPRMAQGRRRWGIRRW